MNIRLITLHDEAWDPVIKYAENCSWRAGKSLADLMRNDGFTDWERVVAAFDADSICGFCTITKTDCIPDVAYTPYIGYVFVAEACRGQRLSERMIRCAMQYLKSQGFGRVYLVSDHVNLYEKYGFHVIDRKTAPWGAEEKIYMQELL